jgi:hypothetical protein
MKNRRDNMKAKEQGLCRAQFDQYVCQKKVGHFGKHHDSRGNYWHSWSDAGAKRILEERAAEERVSKE